MSPYFCLFHASNLSVLTLEFLLTDRFSITAFPVTCLNSEVVVTAFKVGCPNIDHANTQYWSAYVSDLSSLQTCLFCNSCKLF